MTRRASRDAGGNGGNGHHWIRNEKRRRIYERDGWRCVWCNEAVAMLQAKGCPGLNVHGVLQIGETRMTYQATLDHVLPRAKGGSNDAGNLITACDGCNAHRGERSAIEWAFARHGNRADPAYAALDRLISAMGRELPPAKPKVT